MSNFDVRIIYIVSGWCGIKMVINDKLISCNAGFLGRHPLTSLIQVCFDFFTEMNNLNDVEVTEDDVEVTEDDVEEEYIAEARIIWEEEPGSMCLNLKLLKDNTLLLDIKECDDDNNVLAEWHESVSFDDFKNAIVSEGFRVLNAYGLYGFSASWFGREVFPLSSLLSLVGDFKLKWNGNFCSTDLSKEIELLSTFLNKKDIDFHSRYDECKLYYEAWQLNCCGDSFAVGDKVDWTCVMPNKYSNAHGIIIDFEEEHHGFATHSISGTIVQIIAERSEFNKFNRGVVYSRANTIQEVITNTNEYKNNEDKDITLWGYIVTLKDVEVKTLK